MDSQKEARRGASGVAADFSDLPDHDADWLRVVNDVAFVMGKARDSDIPAKATKRKREAEPSTPRRKSKTRA